MSPLLFAFIAVVSASVVAVLMLWSALLPRSCWHVIKYVCASKRDLSLCDNDELVVIVIEKDAVTGQERACYRELASGTQVPTSTHYAKQLIATFTRYDKE